MVELRINGQLVELPQKGDEIKITRQISDVFDLSVVANSYTNAFNIPKSQNNTAIMQYLGMPGDNSGIPYSRNEANVKFHGFDVISLGWLNVSETTDDYKVSVIDGMIDFFKAIEGKTIGVDLDLSNFTHVKTMENIVNSYNNPYYNYIIAGYNGQTRTGAGAFPSFVRAINIDVLVPSFSVRRLFDLIMSTYGYTWESTELSEFINGLYITYPTPPIYEENEEDIVAELDKGLWVEKPVKIGSRYVVPSQNSWTTSDVSEGQLINNWSYEIGTSSSYKFNLKTQAYAKYQFNGSIDRPIYVEVAKNGNSIITIETDPFEIKESEVSVFCQAGDIITVTHYVLLRVRGGKLLYRIHHKETHLDIYRIDSGDVTPVTAFNSFKITDFIKELLYRTGLVPIVNNITRRITFVTINSRIDRDTAIDWTDKYIGRVKENYLKGSYAQKNWFKMKYNTVGDTRNDGVINVNNENIEGEKTLVTSLFYSPDEGLDYVLDTEDVPTYIPIIPMWQKELSEDENGNPAVSYQPMTDRFYFVRKESKTSPNGWALASDVIEGETETNTLWFANLENTLLGQLVNTHYSEYAKIFQNFRSHDIELALGLEDILSLDLTKPYYFAQEGSYYILNKVVYQQGKRSIAEAVKINY